MFCPKCGSQLPEGALVCSRCGASVQPRGQQAVQFEKPAAQFTGSQPVVPPQQPQHYGQQSYSQQPQYTQPQQAPYGQQAYNQQQPYGQQPMYQQPPITAQMANGLNQMQSNMNQMFSNNPKFNGVSSKSKFVAALLCCFFGTLGVHRFYAGKIGTGILWLLTLGCFGIGVFFDLMAILCDRFTDHDGAVLR